MPEVGGDLSRSSQIHPATSPRKKLATENVRTYLNKFWSLMKNQPATRFPELITSLDYVNPIIKKLLPHHLKHIPLAGRITNFVSNWPKLTNDKDIFQIVKGLKIPFLERPSQKQPSTQIKLSQEEKELVDTEVQELLRKGATRPARGSKDQFVSNIFLRLKNGGRFRPIINLKKLNQFIPYSHFKMEGLKQLKDLLSQNDLMVKIRFQWKGNLYEFLCLCFGLGPAPRIFTKLLKIPTSLLRRKNIRLIIYLDDILIMVRSLEEIIMSGDTVIFLLQHLGFIINLQKLEPNIIGTKHKTRVFGDENQFGGHDYVPPRGENDGHYRSVQETLIGEKYNPEGINKSNWKVVFDISSSPPGSSTLSLIGNVPDNKAEGQPLLRRQNKSECSLIRGTKVVVQGSTIGVHRVRTYAYFYWRTHDFGHAYILYI